MVALETEVVVAVPADVVPLVEVVEVVLEAHQRLLSSSPTVSRVRILLIHSCL